MPKRRKFSAKQLANQRRFAEMVRNRVKRRSSTVKVMPRRSRSRVRTITRTVRRRSKGARGALGSAKSIFKDVSAGVGGAVVAEQIAQRVMPQAAPIAGYAGAFIAGGTKGLVGKVAIDAITGQSGLLNMFGQSQSGGGDTL